MEFPYRFTILSSTHSGKRRSYRRFESVSRAIRIGRIRKAQEGLSPKGELEQGDYIASGFSEANRNGSMCSRTPVGNFSGFGRDARPRDPRICCSRTGSALAGLRRAHQFESG